MIMSKTHDVKDSHSHYDVINKEVDVMDSHIHHDIKNNQTHYDVMRKKHDVTDSPSHHDIMYLKKLKERKKERKAMCWTVTHSLKLQKITPM